MTTVYHATSADRATSILAEGFEGGWGDAGFGVYFYQCLHNAETYIDNGGWDGSLNPVECVILEVEVPDSDIDFIIPDPAWPNPEDYEDVVYHPMDADADTHWSPSMKILRFSQDTDITTAPPL